MVEAWHNQTSRANLTHRLNRNQSVTLLTAFSALAKHIEFYITYPTVHVYSEKPIELANAIPTGRGDVTVQILRPDSESILHNARRLKETMVVEPIQIVIDLFCLSGPGRDGAMKLYKEITQ